MRIDMRIFSPFVLSEVEAHATNGIACSMSFDYAQDERRFLR
jgi:hypothetical protein